VRLLAVLGRDWPTCVWCGRTFAALVAPTTEHVVPRVKGGPSRLENEVAACRRCNGERGHRWPVEWLEECLRRGWDHDEARLGRSLTTPAEVIAARAASAAPGPISTPSCAGCAAVAAAGRSRPKVEP
jgi:5-methylcytosine-specific restriction endonuclease McrA